MNQPFATWLSDAHAKWPLIVLDEAGFQAHVDRIGRAPVFPLETYLAAACVVGDPAALRVLEDEFISHVPTMIRRIDGGAAFASEVCQLLRVRLLVSETGDLPRMARYTGEVPLSAWIRVIALRLALNAKRGAARLAPAGESVVEREPETVIDDPEVTFLRESYREPFVRSFQAALARLDKDDRTILRLHYIDGLNIDGIGRIYQVHRATVARWLVRIRAEVLAGAKGLLAAQLGTAVEDVESVLDALAGEVDVTLSRVLR